jgi:hypothetical protein
VRALLHSLTSVAHSHPLRDTRSIILDGSEHAFYRDGFAPDNPPVVSGDCNRVLLLSFTSSGVDMKSGTTKRLKSPKLS